MRSRQAEEESTHVAVLVTQYAARVSAAVNYQVYAPQIAVPSSGDDPLYRFTTQLEISGDVLSPTKRAGEKYVLTVHGADAPSDRINLTLKDAQAVDEHFTRQCRFYRGREVPVYEAPRGIGFLSKARGEPSWRGWISTRPSFMSDALLLLTRHDQLFLAIHERRLRRDRWIRDLSIQTSDPRDD